MGEGGLGDVGDVDVGAGECRVVGSEALFESSGLGAGESWVGDFFIAEEDVGVDFAELEAGVESVCVSLVVGGGGGEGYLIGRTRALVLSFWTQFLRRWEKVRACGMPSRLARTQVRTQSRL